MVFETKNFEHLLGTKGFSDQLLQNHFKLYQGYVTNTNKILELLKQHKPGSLEFNELTRRFGWEFNGMRLHELYFGNLKNNSSEKISSKLSKQIEENFGSFEKWKEDFIGKASMRGIGWVVLCKDQQANKLFNIWVNEHDLGYLAGAIPLLVLDVFEHAFMIDYGLDKKSYINTFFDNVDWREISRREV